MPEMAAFRYDPESLDAAFKAVQPESHWKDTIDAVVAADVLAITIDAIHYFTATACTVAPATYGSTRNMKHNQRYFRVQSIGYRAGPAGDH
jgi:hypothetical protein